MRTIITPCDENRKEGDKPAIPDYTVQYEQQDGQDDPWNKPANTRVIARFSYPDTRQGVSYPTSAFF